MRERLGIISESNISFNPPIHTLTTTKLPFLIKKMTKGKVTNGLSKFLHLEVHRLYFLSHPIVN